VYFPGWNRKKEFIMKIVTADNKKTLVMSKIEWENLGKQAGWMTPDGIVAEAKKQRMDKSSPFRICNESVGTEDTDKRERCIQGIKSKMRSDKQKKD
jgi:hypothetical protein